MLRHYVGTHTYTHMRIHTLSPCYLDGVTLGPDRRESGFIQICVSFFVTCHFSSLGMIAHPSSTD